MTTRHSYGLDHPTWNGPDCFFFDSAAEARASAIKTYREGSGHVVIGPIAESDKGVTFRIEVACDGYANLTEADVPASVVSDEDYIQGARDAAEAIRAALANQETP